MLFAYYSCKTSCEDGVWKAGMGLLDWNVNVIKLYEDMDVKILQEWRLCRLTRENLEDYRAINKVMRFSFFLFL